MNVQNNIRSIRRKPEEGMNKYCHSQIFWILEGARMSFVDFLPFSSARSPEIGLNGFWFRFFRRNSGVTPDIAAEEYAASYKDCWSRIRFRTSTCSSPIRDSENEKNQKSFWRPEKDFQPWIWLSTSFGSSNNQFWSGFYTALRIYWSLSALCVVNGDERCRTFCNARRTFWHMTLLTGIVSLWRSGGCLNPWNQEIETVTICFSLSRKYLFCHQVSRTYKDESSHQDHSYRIAPVPLSSQVASSLRQGEISIRPRTEENRGLCIFWCWVQFYVHLCIRW